MSWQKLPLYNRCPKGLQRGVSGRAQALRSLNGPKTPEGSRPTANKKCSTALPAGDQNWTWRSDYGKLMSPPTSTTRRCPTLPLLGP